MGSRLQYLNFSEEGVYAQVKAGQACYASFETELAIMLLFWDQILEYLQLQDLPTFY